jgi:sec-independent protein translocase protein TatC
MRAFFRKVFRIITTPIRIIAWPFRKIRDFINYEPEDTSTPDVFARTIEQPSVLLEHLDALRKHIFRSLAVLVITTMISFSFAGKILDFISSPVGGIKALQAIEVTESVGAFMRVALLSGFALAFPYILIEVFAFVNPGLKRRERLLILVAIPLAALLFLLGLAFAYFIMLPVALPFLMSFMGIKTIARPSSIISFVTNIMFWIGIAFQFPLLIYALAAIGVIKARSLINGWRFAIIGIAILAAIVTPTVDPVNMALVMAPMIVLYFLSIGLASIAQRGHERRQT